MILYVDDDDDDDDDVDDNDDNEDDDNVVLFGSVNIAVESSFYANDPCGLGVCLPDGASNVPFNAKYYHQDMTFYKNFTGPQLFGGSLVQQNYHAATKAKTTSLGVGRIHNCQAQHWVLKVIFSRGIYGAGSAGITKFACQNPKLRYRVLSILAY